MRGLKIQDKWLKLILNGQKTMEVRSLYLKIRRRALLLLYFEDFLEHLLLLLPVMFGVAFFVESFLPYTPRMLRRHHPTLAVAATVRKLQKKAAPRQPYFKRQTHLDSRRLLGFSEYRISLWA